MTDTPTATDTTTEPDDTAPEQPEQTAGPDTSATDDGRLPDDHPVVKALAKANKEAQEARLRIKEFEDASKSEQEKAAERAQEAQQRAETAESELARHKAALEYGLPADAIEQLADIPADKVDGHAKWLAEKLQSVQPDRPPASRNQGATGGATDPDPDQLADRIWNRNKI